MIKQFKIFKTNYRKSQTTIKNSKKFANAGQMRTKNTMKKRIKLQVRKIRKFPSNIEIKMRIDS